MLALVTDSTCGLTRVEADELGVIVLPMTYSVDGVRYSEAPVGENGDYGSLISAGSRVETEAVHPSAFERVFRERLAAGDDVLCVTISSRLSGTFRSAEEAAAAVDPSGKRVVAFDSWNTAGALEFLVRRAHELAAGGCSLSEVVAGLAEARRGTRIVFSVPDMGALFRSGRLGAIRRAVATKLNRYPVMTLHEGGIEKYGDGRGARGMATAMVRRAPEGSRELVVSHFGPRGVAAREVFLAARSRLPEARGRVKDGGPVLAKHLGLGAVGLSWA